MIGQHIPKGTLVSVRNSSAFDRTPGYESVWYGVVRRAARRGHRKVHVTNVYNGRHEVALGQLIGEARWTFHGPMKMPIWRAYAP